MVFFFCVRLAFTLRYFVACLGLNTAYLNHHMHGMYEFRKTFSHFKFARAFDLAGISQLFQLQPLLVAADTNSNFVQTKYGWLSLHQN